MTKQNPSAEPRTQNSELRTSTSAPLREAARELLLEKKVDFVLGYERGPGLRAAPVFIRDAKDADRLIFDATCSVNLATHLRRALRAAPGGTRAAVVAKGCDGRAVVQHIAEGQFKREDVVVIGVGCHGVVDATKARGRLDRAALSDSCLRCRYPNPPVCDRFAGEPAPGSESDGFEAVARFEKLSAAERWASFEHEFAKCIRCYACRNACPMCYCDECFVDQTDPQWFGKSAEGPDLALFHVVRALHTAGRCVDCGACERACPLGVRLGLLTKRIEKEVLGRFGYTSGLDPEAKPALATHAEEDRQEFIL